MSIVCPKPARRDVQACQFSSWYPTFRRTRSNDDTRRKRNNDATVTTSTSRARLSCTMRSIVLSLPKDVVDYLLSDGVRFPECATKVSSCLGGVTNGDDDDWSDSSLASASDDGSDEKPRTFSFPALTAEITAAIGTLGGNVLPKLNWSSPRDATWMNSGSMKCRTPGDVYLLLKSSDFVVHDLLYAWDDLADSNLVATDDGVGTGDRYKCDGGSEIDGGMGQGGDNRQSGTDEETSGNDTQTGFQFELVLRKWCNLHPSMEFRCFVFGHELGEFLFATELILRYAYLSPKKYFCFCILLKQNIEILHSLPVLEP